MLPAQPLVLRREVPAKDPKDGDRSKDNTGLENNECLLHKMQWQTYEVKRLRGDWEYKRRYHNLKGRRIRIGEVDRLKANKD